MGFRRPEIPKWLPYSLTLSSAYSASFLVEGTGFLHLPERDLFGPLYCLKLSSYPSRFPLMDKRAQVSPTRPRTSRCEQQPNSLDVVIPFRASPHTDFHRFTCNRVYRVTSAPVSVSPNLGASRPNRPPIGGLDWVESGIST